MGGDEAVRLTSSSGVPAVCKPFGRPAGIGREGPSVAIDFVLFCGNCDGDGNIGEDGKGSTLVCDVGGVIGRGKSVSSSTSDKSTGYDLTRLNGVRFRRCVTGKAWIDSSSFALRSVADRLGGGLLGGDLAGDEDNKSMIDCCLIRRGEPS